MKHRKVVRLGTVWCLCLLMSSGLLTVDADDVIVGMSAAFRGPSRGLGIELYRGTMAYLEHVNQAGGIDGQKILIRAYDDGYDPLPAIHNTIRLIETDRVSLLLNYVGTPTVTRVLPLLKRYSDRGVYLFFPFTGAQPQREAPYDSFVYNLRASYQQETEGLVDNLVAIGRERIAVFYQADAYGRSGWDGVRRALSKHGLEMVGEATYRRGTQYTESFERQVEILQKAEPSAIISVGAYAACAGFIRDVRSAGWNIPIANVSFVGSENLLDLLLQTSTATGVNCTTRLINSQVVPSYEDASVPAVREYRTLMTQHKPMPPRELMDSDYAPLPYSFVSFEGFLNAKLLVEILTRAAAEADPSDQANIRRAVESVQDYDMGIGASVGFSEGRNQGLDKVYYTTVHERRFVPLTNWEDWAQ